MIEPKYEENRSKYRAGPDTASMDVRINIQTSNGIGIIFQEPVLTMPKSGVASSRYRVKAKRGAKGLTMKMATTISYYAMI